MSEKELKILKRWKKNTREEIRVTYNQYKGRHMFSIRVWYLDENGKFRPGKMGVNLGLNHLENTISGLRKTRKTVKALGYMD